MFQTLMRTVIVYFLLLIAMRITGKRQLGELQLSELITALLISEIASFPISDLSVPLVYSIISTVLIICLEIAIPCLANTSSFFSRLIEGHPVIIISKGKLIQKELVKSRIGIDELICELRLKGFTDLCDVEYAILEQNGKLSVVPKQSARPVTLSDMGIHSAAKGFAHPIILSGKVSKYNLRLTGKDEDWLMKKLQGKDPHDVLLMTLDDNDGVNIILDNNKESN